MSAPLLSQHARLITVQTALGSALPESLVVESFSGTESINGLFKFDIQLLSPSAFLDLHPFIGEEITLKLLLANHQLRVWHGYCQEASWMGADGGIARYHLHLSPFLTFLKHRYDAYIFQNKNAYEIVKELLDDYPQANFRWLSQKPLKNHPIYTQYRESDYEFLCRLLSNEGLNFRFDHLQEDELNNHASETHAKHCLVIFDANNEIPELTGQPKIRFHAVRAAEAEDSIHQLSAIRQVQSNAVSLTSWSEAQLLAQSSEVVSIEGNGQQPSLPVYQGSLQEQYEDAEDSLKRNDALLQANLLLQHRLRGKSGARLLSPGYAFSLTEHDRYPAPNNRFYIHSVSHLATNNFIHGVHQEAESITAAAIELFNKEEIPIFQLERGIYRNTFEVTPANIPISPISGVDKSTSSQLGPQPAIVVGYENASLTTDRKQRVKVQFMWQRGVKPVSGGLQDTYNLKDKIGNAPLNEVSGTWVRVAEALAGANWGSQFTPRIGAEVLVQFTEGDGDLPLIVATLFNGEDSPPYFAGIDSGVNHAGVISGWHSQGLEGQDFNQWVLDDTQGQLRMRLASSIANSQLNLGYLVQQSPFSAQRGVFRGEGFELRTQAWGMLRGQEGVLISSSSRSQMGASVSETQMDMRETVNGLLEAQAQSQQLTQYAEHQDVLFSQPSLTALNNAIGETNSAQSGHYVQSVNEQSTSKPHLGTRTLNRQVPVERMAQPWVVVDSASSLHWASTASSVLTAGTMLQWSSQADALFSAAKTISHVSGNAISWLSAKGGLHATAAHGSLSLRAHSDAMQLWGDKQLSITSSQTEILIKAKQAILLKAGQSTLSIQGQHISFACPGKFTVKTGQHAFRSAGKVKPTMKGLPTGSVALVPPENPAIPSLATLYDEAFILKNKQTGKPIKNKPYRIKLASGSIQEGITDKDGRTHLTVRNAMESLEIYVKKIITV